MPKVMEFYLFYKTDRYAAHSRASAGAAEARVLRGELINVSHVRYFLYSFFFFFFNFLTLGILDHFRQFRHF